MDDEAPSLPTSDAPPALEQDVSQFNDILQLCRTRGLLDLDQSGIAIATEWAASLEEAAHLFPPDKRPPILEVGGCLRSMAPVGLLWGSYVGTYVTNDSVGFIRRGLEHTSLTFFSP